MSQTDFSLPLEQVNIPLSKNKRILVTIAALIGVLIFQLLIFSVNLAQPKIIADLGGMTYYALMLVMVNLGSTVTRPVAGKMGDVYGRKMLLIIALSTFLASCLLCGLSQNIFQLMVFRAFEGIATGFFFNACYSLMADIWEKKPRVRVIGLEGFIIILGTTIGLFLGGFMVEHLSWRGIFFSCMPFIVFPLIVFITILPKGNRVKGIKIDYIGVIPLIIAMVSLLLGISWLGKMSWTSPQVLGIAAVFVISTIAFILWQKYIPETISIVPRDLIKDRTYILICIGVFFAFAGSLCMGSYFPLYAQAIRGISATETAVYLAPSLFVGMASSIATGWIVGKAIKSIKLLMIISSGLYAIGLGLFAAFMSPGTSYSLLWTMLLFIGIPSGMVMSIWTIAVQTYLPSDKIGIGMGFYQLIQAIGASVGVATGGYMLNHYYNLSVIVPAELRDALGSKISALATPNALMSASTVADIQASLPPQLLTTFNTTMDALRNALNTGICMIYLACAIFYVCAIIVGILYSNKIKVDQTTTQSTQA